MTSDPTVNPAAPEVSVPPLVSCGAGTDAVLEVFVRHPGPRPARLTVMVVGLDPGWVPAPMLLGPVQPGEIIKIDIPIHPEPGALGARYPFVVAVESSDPLAGRVVGGAGTLVSSAESTLAVGVRERAVVGLDPVQVTAVFSRKVRLRITNPSAQHRELTVRSTVPKGLSLGLRSEKVTVAPGRTVTVPARVRVRRPRLFGSTQVHTYAVSVRGEGASVVVDGTVRARPMFRGALVKALAIVTVIALWAGLAVIAIPNLVSNFTSNNSTTDQAGGAGAGGTGTEQPPGETAPGDGSGGAAGAGGDGSAGADGAAGAPPGAAGAAPSLRGVVTGADPGGVTVILAPTSLVEAAAAGAQPAPGVTDDATAQGLRAASSAFGKVPASALRIARTEDAPSVNTSTEDDGTFLLAGIRTPGFYLLTFARSGFQTQRFIVNSATLAGSDPMKVALTAGEGSLSGTVTSANGPVGAAAVTITDGTVSLATSTVSEGGDGAPGSWNVTGLSTPGTYLVSAARPGFGTASSLVTVDAGGTATADLTMVSGVAAITGQVSGVDQLGRLGGIGGISVAVTGKSGDVTTSRSATTVTSGPVGRFTLPDLPTPGDYTLTVSGTGYQDQVRQISLAAGAGSADVAISLTRADGVVTGTVSGNPAAGDQPDEGGLIGAGLTLTGPQGAAKTMTTSDPPGAYRFTGVAPGVYVLAGTMFGRVPSSVTVEVKAAGDTTADLRLLSAADTELPATARIRGRAVDSRTGGDLTCDRSPTPDQPCVLTASVQAPVVDPATGRIAPNGQTETITVTAGPGEDYVLPSPTDTAHPGLVPGLYTVTLSAPGYEPATTSVQVAQGQVVPAAQVSLSPLGIIAGRLTTRVGQPTGTTCIAVTATGVPPPAEKTSCTPGPDGQSCTVGTDPAVRCGLVQADGTYQVRGLVHGGYTVVVLPSDPEYLPPQPFDVQVELGSDARYDPVLDRLGRIEVTVQAPNQDTAELAPVAGATVTATIGATTSAQGVSGDDGVVLLTGLQGTYALTATGPGGSASVAAQNVQLNGTVQLTMVLTASIGTVIGQIVTNAGEPSPVGVPGAPVRVTGVIGFNGITPIFAFADLVTDSHGCFAIVPDSATTPPAGPTAGCPDTVGPTAFDTVNVAGASLVALPVTISVSETDGTKPLLGARVQILNDGALVKSLPVTPVDPKPSPTNGLSLISLPTGAARAPATVTVLARPPGAGQVAVTEDGTGALSWTDPAIGPTNFAAPGRYTLTASVPGWSTTTADVVCPLGDPCTFVTPFQIVRNPTFVGSVAVLPAGGPAPSSAVYTVTPLTSGLPPITLSANGNTLVWQEDGSPQNLVHPGTYLVTASLPGYESAPVTFNCAAASPPTGAEICQLFPDGSPLTLRQLATPTITLTSSVAGAGSVVPLGATVLLTGATIGTVGPLTAQPVPGQNAVSVTMPPLSTFDTSFTVTIHAAGFLSLTGLSLAAANCVGPPGSPVIPGIVVQPGPNTCALTLTQLGRIPVRSWQTNPNTAPGEPTRIALSSVSLSAQQLGSPAAPFAITTAADGTGLITGTLDRDGLLDGTYRITASKVGYDTTTVDVLILGGVLRSLPFGIPIVGDLDITLQVRPVTLQVQLRSGGTVVFPAGSVSVVGNNVARLCTIVTPAGGDPTCSPAEDGTSIQPGPNGFIAFGNLAPAVYTVTFTPADERFRPLTIPTPVVAGIDPQPLLMQLGLRASTESGTVLDPNGIAVAGAAVSLRPDTNLENPAKDLNGADLVATSDGAGGFTFSNIPDGRYRAMVDADGWDRFVSSTPIVMDSSLSTTPAPLTLRLPARTSRTVTATLTSTADGAAGGAPANLAGAAVTFRPVPGTQPAGTPANVDLSGFVVSPTSPFTVTGSPIPTGTWTLLVTPSAGSAFGPFQTASFQVTAPPRGIPAPPPDTNPQAPPIPVGLTLTQGLATITVSWAAGCAAQPATGSLPIELNRATPAASVRVNAPVTANADGSGSATLQILLPPGDFSWTARPPVPGWTGGSNTFSVPNAGTPPVSSTATLLAPQVPVTATLTVDGSGTGGRTVAATPAGGTAVTAQTNATGSAAFCLAPTPGWTFSVNDDASTPPVLIADRTGVNITRAGPNVVAFVGSTVTPTIALATVARRTPDTTARAVALTLSTGGTTVWTGTTSIAANGTSVTGPALIIGSGNYTLTADPAGDVFGVGTATLTAAQPTVTITLPYAAVTLAVTVTAEGTPRTGAQVTLTPATGPAPPAQATNGTGIATFRDIAANTYGVAAQATIGGVAYSSTLTGQALAAGSPQLTVVMVPTP